MCCFHQRTKLRSSRREAGQTRCATRLCEAPMSQSGAAAPAVAACQQPRLSRVAWRSAIPESSRQSARCCADALRVGRDVSRRFDLGRLKFADSSLQQLNDDGCYEVVILSNMLNYLNIKQDFVLGCRNAWRALKPGGWLVIHTPHFWTVREPFTKLPLLQFLPRFAQDFIARASGRRSTMGDIRLPSLGEIRRFYRKQAPQQLLYSPSRLSQRLRSGHVSVWVCKGRIGR